MRDQLREQQRDFRAAAPSQQPLENELDQRTGQIVMGPSFYVWDESPRQAREWGVELANAWLARRR